MHTHTPYMYTHLMFVRGGASALVSARWASSGSVRANVGRMASPLLNMHGSVDFCMC